MGSWPANLSLLHPSILDLGSDMEQTEVQMDRKTKAIGT